MARKELGEYMQRGVGQRPTGAILAHAPIISHEKDWGQVDIRLVEALEAERRRRHPGGTYKK